MNQQINEPALFIRSDYLLDQMHCAIYDNMRDEGDTSVTS